MSDFRPVSIGFLAAIAWGAADFAGGVTSKKANVYRVVIGAELIGVLCLIPIAIIRKEPMPSLNTLVVASLGGFAGGFGLILLYRALASGQMSIAAPVSALGGALTPVLFGSMLEGIPKTSVLIGIALALIAIVLVSYSNNGSNFRGFSPSQLKLPGLAGVLFGIFFILLHQSSQEALLWPIVAVRVSSVTLLTVIATSTRQTYHISRSLWPLIILSGLLDTTGNVLYVIAGQLGRLDVAAVLSSLYPAITVGLAYWILKERISQTQWLGVIFAFTAIIFIVL